MQFVAFANVTLIDSLWFANETHSSRGQNSHRLSYSPVPSSATRPNLFVSLIYGRQYHNSSILELNMDLSRQWLVIPTLTVPCHYASVSFISFSSLRPALDLLLLARIRPILTKLTRLVRLASVEKWSHSYH